MLIIPAILIPAYESVSLAFSMLYSAHGVLCVFQHKLESRLLGEISITSDMQMTPPLWQKVKRNSKAS